VSHLNVRSNVGFWVKECDGRGGGEEGSPAAAGDVGAGGVGGDQGTRVVARGARVVTRGICRDGREGVGVLGSVRDLLAC
jgi:hypothetical protein